MGRKLTTAFTAEQSWEDSLLSGSEPGASIRMYSSIKMKKTEKNALPNCHQMSISVLFARVCVCVFYVTRGG